MNDGLIISFNSPTHQDGKSRRLESGQHLFANFIVTARRGFVVNPLGVAIPSLPPVGIEIPVDAEQSWVGKFRFYPESRGPREGTSRTVYYGAAQMRLGNVRVTVLLQQLPRSTSTLPHYHRTDELFVCLSGGFLLATVPKDGGTVSLFKIAPAGISAVGQESLHAMRCLHSEDSWNVVFICRSKRTGHGIMKNHYWKDVPPSLYENIQRSLGIEQPAVLTSANSTTAELP